MPSWRVANASVPGTRHVAQDQQCQDYHLVDYVTADDGRSETLLVALADGAGSAFFSKEGARIACNSAILFLKQKLHLLVDADSAAVVMRACFLAARRELQEAAASRGLALRDLATTLLLAVVGAESAAFAQVGDGAIIVGNANGLRVAHWPEQETLDVTDFLTDDALDEIVHINFTGSRLDKVACTSDGLSPVLLNLRERKPHAPIMDRLFSECAMANDFANLNVDLEQFLLSSAVNDRTDDDKSLVLAIRNEGHA